MTMRCLSIAAVVLSLGLFSGEVRAQSFKVNKFGGLTRAPKGGLAMARRAGVGRYLGYGGVFKNALKLQNAQNEAVRKAIAQQQEAQKQLAEKRLRQRQAAADAAKAAKERERERVKARLANGGGKASDSKEKKPDSDKSTGESSTNS